MLENRGCSFCVVLLIVFVSASALQPKKQLTLHAAPMQAYTNRFLRYFYRLLSPSCYLWTEMEKLEDLLESEDACSRRLSFHHREHPLVLQLGGNSPSQLRAALAASRSYPYDEINLNVGCPSIETGGANYGAALMTQPKLVSELMDVIRTETHPQTRVSIKCRIGVHDKLNDNASPPSDTYETLHAFVAAVTGTGSVDHVVVHARSAILGGLSSVKNRQIPPLRHDFVHQLSRDFPSLARGVTLNGGIRTIAELHQHMAQCLRAESNVQGIMLGRWLLRRPLDLLAIDRMFELFNHHSNNHVSKNSNNDICSSSNSNSTSISTSNSNDCGSTTANTFSPLFSEYSQESTTTTDMLIEAIEQYATYAQMHAVQKIYPLSQIMLPLILISEQLQDDWNFLEDSDNNDDNHHHLDHTYGDTLPSNLPSSNLPPSDPPPKDLYATQLLREQIWMLYRALWAACDAISASSSSSSTRGRERVPDSTASSSDPSFRKLNLMLTNQLGKKVANKIIKNRNEI